MMVTKVLKKSMEHFPGIIGYYSEFCLR